MLPCGAIPAGEASNGVVEQPGLAGLQRLRLERVAAVVHQQRGREAARRASHGRQRAGAGQRRRCGVADAGQVEAEALVAFEREITTFAVSPFGFA